MPDTLTADLEDGPVASASLSFETVGELEGPGTAERRAILERPATEAEHGALFRAWPLFRQVEVRPAPQPVDAKASLRVVAWNMERGKYVPPSATILKTLNPDVCLLSELDVGMARSGQRHTLAELADRTNQGYVYGVEFLEVSLGDEREREWHAGVDNARGFHGGGLMSPRTLMRPALVRLESSGYWWQKRFKGQVRVGGRIAVLASVEVDGRMITVAAPHFESHTDPDHRAEQMAALLAAIEAYSPGAPVIIGGDVNTNTLGPPTADREERRRRLDKGFPGRFADPVRFEPLFEVARALGYEWQGCNVAGATTTRTRPDGEPKPPHGKIDWFFTRGLAVSDAAVIPAVDEDGQAISDHEIIAVSLRPA